MLSAVVAAIIGGAIGAAIGAWAAFKIAKKAGSFRKPMLDVWLMNEPLSREREPLIQVIFGYSAVDDDAIFCRLPFMITNIGQLSAKDVIIIMDFPRILKFGVSDDLPYKLEPKVYDESLVRRQSSDIGGFKHVIHTFPDIKPGQGIGIEEVINVTGASGMRSFKVDAIRKDGVPLEIGGSFEWISDKTHVTVTATDTTPIHAAFQVRSCCARDEEELKKKIMLEEENLMQKMRTLRVRHKAFIVMPKLKKIRKSKKRSVLLEEPQESERYVIEPFEKTVPPLVFQLASKLYHKFKRG